MGEEEKEYPSEIELKEDTKKEVNLSMERSRKNGKTALFVLVLFAMLFSFALGGAACYVYYFSYPGLQFLKRETQGTQKEEINLARVSKKLGAERLTGADHRELSLYGKWNQCGKRHL